MLDGMMAKIPGTHTLPAALEPRKGTPSPRLAESEFRRRFLSRFQDPAFESLRSELDKIASAAWDAYENERKAPHTHKAGAAFKDPDYDLSVDWIRLEYENQKPQQTLVGPLVQAGDEFSVSLERLKVAEIGRAHV